MSDLTGDRSNGAGDGSPLAGLRAKYKERQESADDLWVDVWEDGSLVAKIQRVDTTGASRIIRTIGAMVSPDSGVEITTKDLAEVIAAATESLHERREDGTMVPILDPQGTPLRFDRRFGEAIGAPELATPVAAVIGAFTDGDPPSLNTVRMMACATTIAGLLSQGRATHDAEVVVGEASPAES